jgi:threonylcarbamoyladenosine tRNA methylthiotransferase MtaB
MTPGTFALATIGCRLNQYELEALGARLEALGFQEVAEGEPADVTVINTCSVTARADADGRKALRRARRQSPGGKIVVTGCFASAQPDELRVLGDVDLIVDNRDKDRLAERMVDAFGYAIPGGVDWEGLNSSRFALGRFRLHTRAMVKIQDGCQEACTYCIIPRARGHERSRAPEAVLDEVHALEAGGYREIVLTGVHAGKYRCGELRLAGLIQRILGATRIPQIRLSSLEPRELRPELIDLLATEPRLCPHLHIALQSGDDQVLRAMRRSYDSSYVMELFHTLAAQRPGLAIGTDVITGFPGESESAFERTVAFVRSLPLAYLHVFSYSDRPGTAAVTLPDKVPAPEIRRRTAVLRRLDQRLRERFIGRHIGRTIDVLIERRRDSATGRLVGMSGNFLRVQTEGPDLWMNEIVPLHITGSNGRYAKGEAAGGTHDE